MSTYRTIVVDQGGRTISELTTAKVDHVTWELNAPGEAVYRIPVLHADALTARNSLLQSEVQIWRDGVLIFWGIPMTMQADEQTAEFLAFGLLYYFATRFFGPVYSNTMPSPLMVGDGNFEGTSLPTGWFASSPSPTIAVDSTHHYTGTKSIKLTGNGDPNGLTYIYQSALAIPSPARSKPLTLTLSARCYPQDISVYAAQDRGIEIQYNTVSPPYPQSWALLNANVPNRRWTRLETQLDVPAGGTRPVAIALIAPTSGSVSYDSVRFTYEQKTGAVEGEDWVNDYLRRVFNYGAGNTGGGAAGPGGSPTSQDAWWGAPVLKSSLGMNFTPPSLAAGSVPVDTFWNHEDAGNILDAMLEVPKRDKADFEITWNRSGTERGLTSFIPRKGSVKRALAAELGRNIKAFSYNLDGRQTANDVRVVGRNSGNTKEVGQAGGPYPQTLGGTQFEAVMTPPQEVDGQGLIDTAVTAERQIHNPVIVPTVTVGSAGMLDTANVGGPLVTGDIIPVRMNYGPIQENDVRRVVKMILRPGDETLELVLNVVA